MYKGCIFLVSNCQSADLFLSEIFLLSHVAMQQLVNVFLFYFFIVCTSSRDPRGTPYQQSCLHIAPSLALFVKPF